MAGQTLQKRQTVRHKADNHEKHSSNSYKVDLVRHYVFYPRRHTEARIRSLPWRQKSSQALLLRNQPNGHLDLLLEMRAIFGKRPLRYQILETLRRPETLQGTPLPI